VDAGRKWSVCLVYPPVYMGRKWSVCSSPLHARKEECMFPPLLARRVLQSPGGSNPEKPPAIQILQNLFSIRSIAVLLCTYKLPKYINAESFVLPTDPRDKETWGDSDLDLHMSQRPLQFTRI